MRSETLFKRQVAAVITVAVLLLAAVTSSLVSAAQVSQRSVSLSNSSINMTGVTYQVNFTAIAAASAFVIDFCSNSPTIGQACTIPAGFDATTASSITSGFSDVASLSGNTLRVTGTLTADGAISVALDGITNPSTPGPLYARIVTYDTALHANAYTSENIGAGSVDTGGLAMAITDTVGVSGSVLESMTFCLSGSVIGVNCTGATSPAIQLGEVVGTTPVLSSDALSTGTMYTQISTNAASGVVVRLKSNALGCGGLIRSGAPEACDIAPALRGDVVMGEPKFGVKIGTVTDTGSSPSGIFQPVAASGYGVSAFALNYAIGNAAGVTSTFGDPFLDTGGAAVNNKNMSLIFGASISNDTPAGMYSADLSLIAAGKF